MLRLPPELHQAIFHHLDFKELVRVQTVCRQWQQIILDSSLWPSSVEILSRNCDTWEVNWPDWADKQKEIFTLDHNKTCQVLSTASKGSTKSLSVTRRKLALQGIFDVLPNFLFLENLRLDIVSISSRELISILQSLPQIITFTIYIDKLQRKPMGRPKTIQLNLRKLFIDVMKRSSLHNTVANVVKHSPNLVWLAVKGTPARKELTLKFGDGIHCLTLCVDGKLPPISARGLKCLTLSVLGGPRHEPFEHRPCDLSYLTHLQLCTGSGKLDLSLMGAYNIGENLEFLHLGAPPKPELFLRAPKLKALRLLRLSISMPLHVSPALRAIQCVGILSERSTIESNETERQLESQGYIVTRIDWLETKCIQENLSVCDVCGESYY
jgi:hypothetical protein